jgi:hypothetical protein
VNRSRGACGIFPDQKDLCGTRLSACYGGAEAVGPDAGHAARSNPSLSLIDSASKTTVLVISLSDAPRAAAVLRSPFAGRTASERERKAAADAPSGERREAMRQHPAVMPSLFLPSEIL